MASRSPEDKLRGKAASSAAASSRAKQGGDQSSSAEGQASSDSSSDVAIVCGLSGDGQGIEIIRKRGERLETGTVRRLEQGKPIHGEVVRLRPREQQPYICDVEVQLPAPAAPAASVSGPAQVATETYRKNWDAIYGRNRKARSLLN